MARLALAIIIWLLCCNGTAHSQTHDASPDTAQAITKRDSLAELEDEAYFSSVCMGCIIEKVPVPIKKVEIVIPDYIDRYRRIEGTVFVTALVDRQGKVRKAFVRKSDAEIFNEPAISAAMQSVFSPGILNDRPTAMWVSIPFRFKLGR